MSPASVGHCGFCNGPVYGEHADRLEPAHPCCAWWMGVQGHRRCVACGESRKARRERLERHERLHVRAKVVDPSCEHCTGRAVADLTVQRTAGNTPFSGLAGDAGIPTAQKPPAATQPATAHDPLQAGDAA